MGQVLNRDQLLKVWGYRGGVATRTVDTHVLTVQLYQDNIQSPIFIQTLHGVGYKFIASCNTMGRCCFGCG